MHWRLLLDLEVDLIALSRYVEFSEQNFDTYSMRLASLLLSASSEVDVVAKLLCKKISPKSKPRHIGDYGRTIGSRIPEVGTFIVHIPKFGLCLNPWKNWSGKSQKSPDWWKCHNKVKHERNKHYSEANLENTLNAVSGLFVLLLFLYEEMAVKGNLSPNPVLFAPPDEHAPDTLVDGAEITWMYHLRKRVRT